MDGLAQGSKTGQYESEEHARKVKQRAKATIDYLELEFEKKNSHLKAQTSKGSTLETIAFRSEETDKSVSIVMSLYNAMFGGHNTVISRLRHPRAPHWKL